MLLRGIFLVVLILDGFLLFLAAGFSSGHSAVFNYSWSAQYIDAFGFDALLPRHLPGLWDGLGGYDFFFYGPLPFWFNAAFVSTVCVGCSTETVFVIGTALFWLLSGATFYVFLRRYFDTRHAVFGSIVYSILPYHLWIDWFIRQAVGEFVAYAFVPLIALGFDKVKANEQRGWILSIGIAGITLCHLPTALLAAHVFGLATLVTVFQKIRQKEKALRFLVTLVGWVLLGLLLSCFYWLPALALLDSVSSNALYTSHFIAERWLFGLRLDQPDPVFARVVLAGFLTVLPFIAVSVFLARGALRMWLVIPVVLSMFLNLEMSAFIWNNWVIQKVQFPWRLMVLVDFSAALAITYIVAKLDFAHKLKVLSATVLLAAFPASIVLDSAKTWMQLDYDPATEWSGATEYLSPEMLAVVRKRLGAEKNAIIRLNSISDMAMEISSEFDTADVQFKTIQNAPRRVVVQPTYDVQRLSIPLQYWFLWRAELEGDIPLQVTANPQLGTIDVIAPQDGFQGRRVTLTLAYHISEKIGFVLSILALVIFAMVALPVRWRKKNRRQNQASQQ